MELSIIPECYVDTNLMETLAKPEKGYNHQKGCGTVAKKMQTFFADRFAVGIIDKDKNVLAYLAEFEEVANSGNLYLLKHKSRHHYFILIRPAIEQFILDNAALAGLCLSDYGLPEDFDELKKVSKSESSKYDHRFTSLFRDIMDKETDAFTLLRSWLTYLKEQNYKADVKELQTMAG